MYARDPEIIEAAFDTGRDPLDALTHSPDGPAYGYTGRPSSNAIGLSYPPRAGRVNPI